VSCKIDVNGQRTDGQPGGRPENAMPLLPIVGNDGTKTARSMLMSSCSGVSPKQPGRDPLLGPPSKFSVL